MRPLCLLLLAPVWAYAQTLPATHPHSGLSVNTARTQLERDSRRPFGPKGLAYAMPLPPAMEFFPGLKLPGQKDEFQRPASILRVVRPEFRIAPKDLGIADVHDVLFFASTRILRMRVTLLTQNETMRDRWLKPLRSFFDHLDRDNDGYLNKYEAEFVVPNVGIQQMMTNGFFTPSFTDSAKLLADFDLDQDGRINFDEFASHYSPSASRLINVQVNPIRDFYADPLTEEMFKLLDTNKDGRLTQNELQSVEKMFANFDTDEDECLVALELVPTLFSQPMRQPAIRPTQDQLNSQQPIIAYKAGAIPDAVIENMLKRYDKDNNLRLNAKENPFSAEVFKKLDNNSDGELAVTELMTWRDLPAEIELELKLADKPEDNAVTLKSNSIAATAPFQPAGLGMGLIRLGTQNIQFSCNPPRAVTQNFAPQFFAFPDGGKGYILEKDIAGPQFQALRILFDVMDRDADNRVTRAEFDAFSRLQNNFRATPLTLVYGAQTPSLFHLMDTSGDGRLSVREVRTAWTRLIAMEPNGKDAVTRAALQPQGAIRFGRATEVFNVNPLTAYQQPTVRQTNVGPLWFRKLDRNGDGELSRKEYPGAVAEFDELDADHDGYVSVAEAETMDKKRRGQK